MPPLLLPSYTLLKRLQYVWKDAAAHARAVRGWAEYPPWRGRTVWDRLTAAKVIVGRVFVMR